MLFSQVVLHPLFEVVLTVLEHCKCARTHFGAQKSSQRQRLTVNAPVEDLLKDRKTISNLELKKS